MADSFDKYLEFADVYAQALFELAREADRIDDVRSELDELVRLMEIEPAFASFITSSALDDDHRAAGLEKMFRGRLSDMTLNTLLVMNDNGRHALLKALRRAFVLRQEDAAGQVEVAATSAVELDLDEKNRVAEAAAKLSGRKPLIDYRVDPSIVGGLILQIGDLRYDNSVATQLTAARDRLMDRSDRGLAAAAAQ
ncbi:MAG: ATP synthase F1 subunit delta [Planctomycetes bacterium]|nr:ATP synthase F1 subunit delta [Planctomycetota bacterium]